jgi:hypothetical protein
VTKKSYRATSPATRIALISSSEPIPQRAAQPIAWVNGDIYRMRAFLRDDADNAHTGLASAISAFAQTCGTGIGSDCSYQVQGGLEFQLTRSIWWQLGWGYLNYDYRNGGFTNKTELNGPFLQTGIKF